MGCAKTSELGTVSLEVPTLPSGSLKGKIYLGGPESGPITGPPYTLYVDAESKRYGVSVRDRSEIAQLHGSDGLLRTPPARLITWLSSFGTHQTSKT